MAMTQYSIGRGGAGALDTGVAALAAASAAFLVFAMPDALFTGIVAASRLPDFIAAAQPPLGSTARFVAVGAAALFSFLLVIALMRALDRLPAKRAPIIVAEPEPEAPRVRRADAHPDAPSRRPLLARDLGEPQGEPLELTDARPDAIDPEPRPLPGFLVAEQPAEEAAVEETEPVEAVHAEEAGPVEEVPVPQPESAGEIRAEASEPVEPEIRQDAEAPSAGPPEASGEESEESVSELMHRLERGLGRKQQKAQALSAAERPQAEPEAEAPPEDRVGHRLRSAINELQQMAARGG